MEKYYITNGSKYVTVSVSSMLVAGAPISIAKRFKYENANNALETIIKKHPGYCVQKYYSSESNKDYVITNATKFVGNNDAIVKDARKARVFKTAADACGYLESQSKLILELGTPIIVNDKYEPVDVFGKRKLEKQLPIDSQKPQHNLIPKLVRNEVYSRADGKCEICGRPLTMDNFTIDHIIPKSRSGTDELLNLRCTCKKCNQLKADSLDSEMLATLEYIVSNYVFKHPTSKFTAKIMASISKGLATIDNN